MLVTRATAQAAGLAEALAHSGFEPIIIPAIEIVAPFSFASLDAAIQRITDYTWIVFTSVNGVAAFLDRNGSVPPKTNVAAIGEATAQSLREHGIAVHLTPARAVAESLLDALLPQLARNDRVLLVQAEQARALLRERLEAAGIAVDSAIAYRNIIPADSVERIRELFSLEPTIDAVTFTSSSSVHHLLALLDTAGRSLPATVRCISIGPITSATLREAGLPAHAEAQHATIPALVEAVVSALREP